MNYLVAAIVFLIFCLIFILSYYLNSKVKIDCDKRGCEGCNVSECLYHKDGSDNQNGLD